MEWRVENDNLDALNCDCLLDPEGAILPVGSLSGLVAQLDLDVDGFRMIDGM